MVKWLIKARQRLRNVLRASTPPLPGIYGASPALSAFPDILMARIAALPNFYAIQSQTEQTRLWANKRIEGDFVTHKD